MNQQQDFLYQKQQIQYLEKIAVATHGIAEIDLMEQAGAAALQQLRQNWPNAKHIAVVCGSGNNAGDAYVLARLAQQQGLQVTVWQIGQLAATKSIALQQAERCQAAGIAIKPFAASEFQPGDIIVDGLLGIGLQGEVRAAYRQAITAINQANVPVLALDIPSGLAADSGNSGGCAVRATLTVTFIGLKLGLFTGQGPDYSGKIILQNLNLPPSAYQQIANPIQLLANDSLLATYLPKRARIAHKGYFGHVLAIGGDYGMAGAVRMAAEAAARVGAGLVSVASHAEHAAIISGSRPELMCYAVNSAEALAPLIAKATVIAIGPGLGQSSWSKLLFETALNSSKPLIVDADALNLLAQQPTRRDNWILTPHPGEAARLLQTSAQAIQADRLNAARTLQQRYGGTAILKGAGTIICSDPAHTALCAAGNPGMASGGMGDVLTGVLAGLLAQGLSLTQAAQAGTYLHARAADLAAQQQGERGLLALDLMAYLQKLVNWS